MTFVAEVAEAIKIVAESIKNLQSIQKAMKDGKKYLEKAHPDIKPVIAQMCSEMAKTCKAIAESAALITHFKFNGSAATLDQEPARFNEHLVKSVGLNQDIRHFIQNTKGHCAQIKQNVFKLTDGQPNNFWRLFGMEHSQRTAELAQKLSLVYEEEIQMFQMMDVMTDALNKAIADVTNALCVDGLMQGSQVPKAARVLAVHAEPFLELQRTAIASQQELQFLAEDLLY